MNKFSEEQRAELRAGFEQSRIDAREEMARIAQRYEDEKAGRRAVLSIVPKTAYPTAFEIAGEAAEIITALEGAASDLDDDDLSALVFAAKRRVVAVGNYLARLRAGDTPKGETP